MKKIIRFIIFPIILLSIFGCNTTTPVSQLSIPNYSNEKYQNLDCEQLKIKISEINSTVNQLTSLQESRSKDGVGHMLYYGWGKGNGMSTIELVKAKGELNAANATYKAKGCK